MKRKQTKRILRIVFITASIASLYFVPWVLVKAWILPLPDTVQEQVDEAIGHGFDGIIVYVDEGGGNHQRFMSLVGMIGNIKYLLTLKPYLKLPALASYMMLLQLPN